VPVPWNDDPPASESRILANARSLLRAIGQEADRRLPPAVASAQDWHRRLYDGIDLPVPYYAGEIRDSDDRYPELYGYEVAVGPFRGVASQLVPQELESFESNARDAIARLDSALPAGEAAASSADLYGVLTLCALLHGEWIRIHPFANGNGRTARIWANWAALRYGLPPFVSIKPRPHGNPYALAAVAGMQGQHEVAVAAFDQMLRASLRNLS
jgi:fido (protein-threonine AMPylation protein)